MPAENFTNTLYTNDNLFILNGLNSNLVDLIYLDPPFNTNRIFSAPIGSKAAGTSFKDIWSWADVNEAYLETVDIQFPGLMDFIVGVGQIHGKAMASYLTYMAQRMIEMHRILKDTGSLYLHCDTTAAHYLKILLDRIFGKNNFRNEIVWCYENKMSAARKQFPRTYDSIFFYSKSAQWNFNGLKIKRETSIKQSKREVRDGKNMRARDESGNLIYMTSTDKKATDVWTIPYVASTSKERTGYKTQKPLALLQRIIKASSNKGDIVMDPFCGCATTCVAAQQLGRKWLGIDIEKQAVQLLIDRLSDDAGMFTDFIATTKIPNRTDIQVVQPSQSVKERLYKEQNGKCNGCGAEFEMRSLEIDHIIPKAKGGGDYYENYQLLCGSCNRIKGSRPMEYLLEKIKRRALSMLKVIFEE
ncbi:MAG: HNH endonuclease [Ignavibacteria bacterium]|jgi:site-specific DNA-methyltransferase (adenine-specific)|nr:HNH endonuclease [Ignavibacteria bacterium]